MTIGHIKTCYITENEVVVHWEIENFLSYLNSHWSESSSSFTWSSVTWALEIRYNCGNDIQLFLYTRTRAKRLPVVFKFGIQLTDGSTEFRCMLSRNFDSSVDHLGTLELIQKSELVERKYELLHARMLTISCLITHLDTLTKPQYVKYEGKCGL